MSKYLVSWAMWARLRQPLLYLSRLSIRCYFSERLLAPTCFGQFLPIITFSIIAQVMLKRLKPPYGTWCEFAEFSRGKSQSLLSRTRLEMPALKAWLKPFVPFGWAIANVFFA